MYSEQVHDALAAIRRHWKRRPRASLILGTGLGHFAESIEPEALIPYEEIPHFPCSTAISHRGALVCGTLAGIPVVAMQGRCHAYEGYAAGELTLPVYTMHAAGAEVLVVSNASGGVNPALCGGDILVIADHINLMGVRLGRVGNEVARGRSVSRAPLYDPQLAERVMQAARRHNVRARRGVYVAVTGPNYETRAEYRFFRRIGGDVVGMSTVPEVLAAAQVGLRVLALSTVTNVARPDAPRRVTAEDVVSVAEQTEPKVRTLVMDVLAQEFAGDTAKAMDTEGTEDLESTEIIKVQKFHVPS